MTYLPGMGCESSCAACIPASVFAESYNAPSYMRTAGAPAFSLATAFHPSLSGSFQCWWERTGLLPPEPSPDSSKNVCIHILPLRIAKPVQGCAFWILSLPGQSSEYYGTSSRKYGRVLYNQCYLIFVVARDLWYLHLNHHIPQGFGMLPPHSVNRNAPGVIIEILDPAHYQASHFQELRHDTVHAGPRINEDGG